VVTVEEMRLRYEEIKQSWRHADDRERDEDIRQLTGLSDDAASSADEGTEALQVEIEDLIESIQRHVHPEREIG
jgi:hypothetical protein